MSTQERKELDALIKMNGSKSWWAPELFERDIRPHFPTQLTIIAPPLPEAENHNCFVYALGLSGDKDIIRESHGFIYSAFIQHLLNQNLLVKTGNPVPGDLVFYQDLVNYPSEITHAGILQPDGFVISKWAWGPLVRHALMDVPASYGDTVWYVKAPSKEDLPRWYEELKSFNTKQES